MAEKQVDAPLHIRAAAFQPATVDAEARTVDLVWTTGARVRRYSFYRDEYYDEELSLDPKHVDLGRMAAGAPLLKDHAGNSIDNVIGVVRAASINGGEGRATVEFSKRAEIDPIWNDVSAGILRNISVGYRVRKMERIAPTKDGEVPTYRAVDWEPHEISLVAIPADAGAQIRSEQRNTCIVIDPTAAAAAESTARTGDTMSDIVETAATEPAEIRAAAPAVDADAIRAEAVAAERARVSEIRKLTRAARFGDDVADKLIADGVTIDGARSRLFDLMAARTEEAPVRSVVTVTRDEGDTKRALVESAILHQYDRRRFKLEEGANEYCNRRLLDLGAEMLAERGVKVRGLGQMELAGAVLGLRDAGYMGTSDFGAILANVANKTLRQAYDIAPRTFMPLGRQASAKDFKPINRTWFSDAPQFQLVNELGEFKRGSFSDGKETYQLATYGHIVPISRQALINDDLSAFTRLPEQCGYAAAAFQSDTVWAMWTGNPTMADGVALFHASHSNLDSAGAISVATLGTLRSKMRTQKSPQGRVLNLAPKFLIVPAALETTANQFTSSQYVSTKATDINPFSRGSSQALEVIVEGRLDAASASQWYVSADPAQIDTFEYAFLDGQDQPYMESRVGFDVDGLEIKVRLDFAAKFLDYRGVARNG